MKRDFDKEAANWDSNEPRRKLAMDVVERIVVEIELDGSQRLMDFGAGTGLVSIGLKPYVGEVIAVDSSPGMLGVLKEKIERSGVTGVTTLLWDAGRDATPLPGADVIVSSMTLHHIDDVPGIAARFHEALAPGGWIGVADLDLEHGAFHSDPTGVAHEGFDREDLMKTFAAAGFHSLRTVDAHTLIKPAKSGELKSFTVFLLVGRKRPN